MLDSRFLPQNLRRCLEPAEREKLDKAQEQAVSRRERDEQKLFNSWLDIQEGQGRLQVINPQSHRPSTIAAGWPDYTILLPDSQVMLIEMKAHQGRLNKTQLDKITKIEALNHPVFLAWNHVMAINAVQLRLSVILTTLKNDNSSADPTQERTQERA